MGVARAISSLARQGLPGKFHARQTLLDQRADIAMVAALGRGHHVTVVLAKGQQRFLVAQPFQQSQAQGFARTFVLPGRILHAAIVERLRLVAILAGSWLLPPC